MRKLKLFCSSLFIGTMLLQSVPAKADPPPNWVFWYITDTGSVYHWNSETNQYEYIGPKHRLNLYPNMMI